MARNKDDRRSAFSGFRLILLLIVIGGAFIFHANRSLILVKPSLLSDGGIYVIERSEDAPFLISTEGICDQTRQLHDVPFGVPIGVPFGCSTILSAGLRFALQEHIRLPYMGWLEHFASPAPTQPEIE